jgi:hypothetical protein
MTFLLAIVSVGTALNSDLEFFELLQETKRESKIADNII